ncbi:hypothetical protein CEUSTIGMA_g406.t1 [Chlamydomonas eustigma]|uniref:DUF1499 domain-containing protein n=1 Tax=Chlamydomonas eustigma TaxID=1157962 RepID=A0A250WQ81_9CHLO|nr:hypothetical protein CEUSTIGMA_g406.t1 [Chlamydomonas eustigma]|eukprot:GAX72951.1 hypothetical protein CEUSTIGMA_g406.t1 [Chlamydomonas eustigma]
MAQLSRSAGSSSCQMFRSRPRPRCVSILASSHSKVTVAALERRDMILASINIPVLASLLSIGAVERPRSLGVQDYGVVKSLSLCPPTPNCIATSEEANDRNHYVPAWSYNPEDGRALKNPATQEQAMKELVEVVNSLKPDGFTSEIIKQTSDYLYLEYTSPLLGFIDDVEFWFKPEPGFRVEYRSASRIGESDGDVNRKRIKAIRQELEKKGWRSVGF